MKYSDIELEIDDPVAVLRLNRPAQLNAFTAETLRGIRHAIDRCVAIVASSASSSPVTVGVSAPASMRPRSPPLRQQQAHKAKPQARIRTSCQERHLGVGYVEALQEADQRQWGFVAAPDAREGAQALIEKRAPRLTRLGD